jgi:hypothetical protein
VKSLLFTPFAFVAAAGSLSAQAKSASNTNPSGQSYIVAPDGNEARYRVREQLAGFDLPKDAIGATKDIKGRIVIGADGKVVKESSKVVIELSSLKSDHAET